MAGDEMDGMFEFEVVEELNPYRCVTRYNGATNEKRACSPNWTVTHSIPKWAWRRALHILIHGYTFECEMSGPDKTDTTTTGRQG